MMELILIITCMLVVLYIATMLWIRYRHRKAMMAAAKRENYYKHCMEYYKYYKKKYKEAVAGMKEVNESLTTLKKQYAQLKTESSDLVRQTNLLADAQKRLTERTVWHEMDETPPVGEMVILVRHANGQTLTGSAYHDGKEWKYLRPWQIKSEKWCYLPE